MAEGAPLLREYGSKAHRGFESLSLRHTVWSLLSVSAETTHLSNYPPELSHQPTRVREQGMRRFKSTLQAQRFLNANLKLIITL